MNLPPKSYEFVYYVLFTVNYSSEGNAQNYPLEIVPGNNKETGRNKDGAVVYDLSLGIQNIHHKMETK